MSSAIAANLADIRARIAGAAARAGRRAEDITLVAVSKTHPAEAVVDALAAGQLAFGENRVQEAQAKFPGLKAAHPGMALHLIGGLQTNKARDAVRLANVIETLDRPKLADAIADAIAREGRAPRLLVQVNVGDEPQKAGVARADADAFIDACRARFGDALAGLMCIPPPRAIPRRISIGWPSARRATVSPSSRWACPAISRPPSPTAPLMSASAAPSSAPEADAPWSDISMLSL